MSEESHVFLQEKAESVEKNPQGKRTGLSAYKLSSRKPSELDNCVHVAILQPHSRHHLGLLEKHKDYVLRAKDYQHKQAQLKRMHEKVRCDNVAGQGLHGMCNVRTYVGSKQEP